MDPATEEWRRKAILSILDPAARGYPTISIGEQDVWLKGPTGSCRYGYFSGEMFFRENPVPRSVYKHVDRDEVEMERPLKERLVKWGVSEPQYDMVFEFNSDGSLRWVHDKRTSQEVWQS